MLEFEVIWWHFHAKGNLLNRHTFTHFSLTLEAGVPLHYHFFANDVSIQREGEQSGFFCNGR